MCGMHTYRREDVECELKMEQVLPLSDLIIDPREFQTRDISEFTAEEYLAWVRYEAETCPQVVRADIDPNIYAGKQTQYMPQVPEIPCCSDSFQPDANWIDSVIDSFSELRLFMTRLSEDIRTRERKVVVPPLKQESHWFKLCLGENSHLGRDIEEINTPNSAENDSEDDTSPEQSTDLLSKKDALLREFASNSSLKSPENPFEDLPIQYSVGVVPTTSLLLQFDQVLSQKLIGYHVKWLTKRVLRLQSLYQIRLAYHHLPFPPSSRFLWRHEDLCLPVHDLILQWGCMITLHCRWIYSLLARLETPLYQDAAADIREIYRTACLARWDLEQYTTSLLQSADRKQIISRSNSKDLTSNPQVKSCHSKGVVRFSGVFDDEDETRARSLSDSEQIDLEDLSLFSNEVSLKSLEYLAALNTIIIICGKYFGQEEEIENLSSGWSDGFSYEDGEEEEEGEEGEREEEREEENLL